MQRGRVGSLDYYTEVLYVFRKSAGRHCFQMTIASSVLISMDMDFATDYTQKVIPSRR